MDSIRAEVPPFVRSAVERYSTTQSCGELIALQKYPTRTGSRAYLYRSVVTLWQAGSNTSQRCSLCGRDIPPGCLYEGMLIFNRDVSEGEETWKKIKSLKIVTETDGFYCSTTDCRRYWQPTHQQFHCSPGSACAAWHITTNIAL